MFTWLLNRTVVTLFMYYFGLNCDNLSDFILLRFHFLAPVCIFSFAWTIFNV